MHKANYGVIENGWNTSVVFNIVNKSDEIVINRPNCLLGTKVNNTLDPC